MNKQQEIARVLPGSRAGSAASGLVSRGAAQRPALSSASSTCVCPFALSLSLSLYLCLSPIASLSWKRPGVFVNRFHQSDTGGAVATWKPSDNEGRKTMKSRPGSFPTASDCSTTAPRGRWRSATQSSVRRSKMGGSSFFGSEDRRWGGSSFFGAKTH